MRNGSRNKRWLRCTVNCLLSVAAGNVEKSIKDYGIFIPFLLQCRIKRHSFKRSWPTVNALTCLVVVSSCAFKYYSLCAKLQRMYVFVQNAFFHLFPVTGVVLVFLAVRCISYENLQVYFDCPHFPDVRAFPPPYFFQRCAFITPA